MGCQLNIEIRVVSVDLRLTYLNVGRFVGIYML